MANTYSNLLFHVVFSTKNRLPLIQTSFKRDLYSYIGGIIRNKKASLIEIGGMPDHVHLLMKLKTDMAVSDILRHIKRGSSKWINSHMENESKFAWQDGYGVFTVSESQTESVTHYIRNQAEHHCRKTFQEEYLDFLKRHRVEFDERYLWN